MTCEGLARLPPKVYLPGACRNSAISPAKSSARMLREPISTTGTIPVTAIGSKSSSEYFGALETCGITAISVVKPA